MKFFPFNRDSITGSLDVVMQIAQHRIVFQKMCQCLCIGNIVDPDKVDILVADRRAKDIAADAAKSIDAHFDCHFRLRPPSDNVEQAASLFYTIDTLFACASHTSAAAVAQCTSPNTADLLEKRNCKIMPARRQCQAGTLRSFLKPRTVC